MFGYAKPRIRPSPLVTPFPALLVTLPPLAPSSLLSALPPLDIPSTSEAVITRFCVFETKALWTDQWTNGRADERSDGRTDGRTDRPSYRDAWTHLKTTLLHGNP